MTSELYKYPAEKLAAARRILMAPHPKGEADSFAHAFLECEHGLRDIRLEDIDDSARSWLRTIKQAMDTSGIDDTQGRGRSFVKAENLSIEEKSQFSSAIDELADWFNEKIMGL